MLCVSLNCLSAVEAIGRGTRALWPSSSPSPCLNCLSAVEAIGRARMRMSRRLGIRLVSIAFRLLKRLVAVVEAGEGGTLVPCLNCLSAVEAIGSVRRRPQAVGELRGVSIAFRLLKRLVVEAMKQTKDYPRWSQLPFGC